MANADIAVAQRAVARGLIGDGDLAACRAAAGDTADERRLLELLVERGRLTRWQVAQLEAGRTQNLVLGKYILLATLGARGMGAVYRARGPGRRPRCRRDRPQDGP